MRKKMLFLIWIIIFSPSLFSQVPELFRFNGKYAAPTTAIVSAGTQLILNRPLLQELNKTRPGHIEIQISLQDEVLVLQLDTASLFSYNRPDVVLAGSLKQYQFSTGYYLKGKIRGKENSLVALTIFDDLAGGVLSYDGQNYNLCIANTDTGSLGDNYLLYSDKDYHALPPGCETEDDNKPLLPGNSQRPLSYAGCAIDIYFELSYDMYTRQGNNVENLLRYFTILFNGVQTLYKNENILVQIREIKVWDVPDPEDQLTTSRDVLSSFTSRMTTGGFNGDLAQYVTHGLNGGVAWVDVLCNSTTNKTAVSGGLSTFYSPYPNFSFSIEVIAHETGHNIGSRHTHNCTWPGGAIDDCYPVEGSCSPGPTPVPGGGTVMSYCHLALTGISFSNGFGPLPGALIRTNVTDATTFNCICNCSDMELDITTQDIGCGNPLGIAVPVITNGQGPFSFLWSNGSTDSVATGLAAGTYYVKVTGRGAACTVIKGCKITSTGNAIVVNLSPAATNVSKCINENHPLSATVSPAGSYNYQWHKDNVAIPGAVSNTYTATTGGAYYLAISNSSCTGRSQTVNVTMANIAPFSVTVNGSSRICNNDSVRLSIPATTYAVEWLRNGVPVAGATASSYYTNTPGDYTARVYSPVNAACSQLSSPVTIQVIQAPAAAIIPAGNAAICKGQVVTLSHNSVSGDTYKWYKGAVVLSGETNPAFTTGNAGDYRLQVTNGDGCVSMSAVTNVIVNPLPDSAISPFPSFSLCQGGTLKLEIKPATTGATYRWYNGSQLAGTTAENSLNVTASGSYTAVIRNNTTWCESTSDITMVNMIPPPTIFAGNDTILATGQPYQLRAVETSALGVNRYEWTPSTGLNNPGVANPVATLFTDQVYTVKGIHPLGCYGTATIKFNVYKGPAIYIPGAFSPNGDGRNDLLKCFAVGLQSFKYFDIYNRAGERVFRTTNPATGWDGYYKGALVDPGTFVWVAEGVDYSGKLMVQKGTVVIVR